MLSGVLGVGWVRWPLPAAPRRLSGGSPAAPRRLPGGASPGGAVQGAPGGAFPRPPRRGLWRRPLGGLPRPPAARPPAAPPVHRPFIYCTASEPPEGRAGPEPPIRTSSAVLVKQKTNHWPSPPPAGSSSRTPFVQ